MWKMAPTAMLFICATPGHLPCSPTVCSAPWAHSPEPSHRRHCPELTIPATLPRAHLPSHTACSFPKPPLHTDRGHSCLALQCTRRWRWVSGSDGDGVSWDTDTEGGRGPGAFTVQALCVHTCQLYGNHCLLWDCMVGWVALCLNWVMQNWEGSVGGDPQRARVESFYS